MMLNRRPFRIDTAKTKKTSPKARLFNHGAESGTRTRTDYSTRPSNVRGYQLRHLSKSLKNHYFFFSSGLAAFALAGAEGGAATGAAAVFEFASSTAVFELASEAFVFAFAGTSAGASAAVVERTEISPVRAGIEINRAESIKPTAAAIVIFDSTVCVPRGLKAELEILLVKSAPASVLPGCKSTDAISANAEIKNIAYKK